MAEEKLLTDIQLLLQPGTLPQKVIEQTQHARECGKLLSIQTEHEFVEQNDVSFLVRIVSSLNHKDKAKRQQEQASASSGKEFNPFLPYDEDLFVANISDTHVCLLNKFNVVEHHILIVTKEFEEQDNILNMQDFAALAVCLAEIDGLGFYNGGQVAGASQRHKHLQLVPCLLSPEDCQIPIEAAFSSTLTQPTIATAPALPFAHAIAPLDLDWQKSPLEAAAATLRCYHALMQAVGLQVDSNNSSVKQPKPYNLLITRRWMLLVPRSQEGYESIQVNSLGFAGALLVRNPEQMQRLKELGPINLLRQVGMPPQG
ncbi:MAG: ATP adenylyltransferase [Elainellaceae cyanobacterium]